MTRKRRLAHLGAFLVSGLGVFAIGRPFQNPQPGKPKRPDKPVALQPDSIIPTGRFCILRDFGQNMPGDADPIWFASPNEIAVGQDGELYSTSPAGGNYSRGTIFRVSPKGTVKVLYHLGHPAPKPVRGQGVPQIDGVGPRSGLIKASDGYFYGTTYGGGKFGVGTIFRIKPGQSSPEFLWNFRNGSVIGLEPKQCEGKPPRCVYSPRQRADISASYPITAPVMGPGGALYGVTSYSNNQMFGVLYRFTPPYDSDSFHALCIFDQRMLRDKDMAGFVCKAKSSFPHALLLAPDGTTLYGTTLGGNGTVFRATTGGEVTTIHEFDGDDGAKPYSLMLASNGRLYGTTSHGGDAGIGTVYSLETSGDGLFGGGFKVLSSFRWNSWLQGINPVGGLVEAKPRGSLAPYLFGSTRYGGKYGRGILFRIPLGGDSTRLRVLHNFELWSTGRSSMTSPVLGPDGMLYGITYQGGKYDSGVFYRLDPIVLNDQTGHDSNLNGGVPASDDRGVRLPPGPVQVLVHAAASQSGVDPSTGAVVTKALRDGIIVRGWCRNPHIVQFVYREILLPGGGTKSGTVAVGASPLPGSKKDYEEYPLTTNLSDIHWHADSPLSPLGLLEQRNAYFDQGVGAGHFWAPNFVAIFDKPSFGKFDDPTNPNLAEGMYLLANQTADPTKSETWRLTARDFLICNCQVSKEIWWAREIRGGKASFAHIQIKEPIPDALDWINEHLKANGYAPIP